MSSIGNIETLRHFYKMIFFSKYVTSSFTHGHFDGNILQKFETGSEFGTQTKLWQTTALIYVDTMLDMQSLLLTLRYNQYSYHTISLTQVLQSD